MKNKLLISKGIPAIALVFGLFVAGCPTAKWGNSDHSIFLGDLLW